jgi:basic membrane protein A and related proteins
MRRSFVLATLLACLVAATTVSAGGKQDFTVGFIYVGPVGDSGWTFQHDQARKFVDSSVAGVNTIKLESVPEANVGPAIDQLVSQGAKMIFATSFGYGPGVIQKAKQHPDVLFMHATGFMRAKNVSTYFVDHTQGSYLQGILAGRLTKSNVIGYVGSFPITEIIRDVNAYALGAQSVNPEARVKVVLTSTWFDPPKEKQAAKSLIDAGADVLFGIEDSPAVLQQAAAQGKLASTWNSNMARFGPKAFLSANVLNWGKYYAQQVRAAMNGSWKSHDFWGSLKEGSLQVAPLGRSVTPAARTAFNQKLSGFKRGSFNPFVGPIRDQKGKVRLAAGKKMTFGQIVGWNWYVQGVDGKLPKS